MYNIKSTEWELNEEEKEKAKYIQEFIDTIQRQGRAGYQPDPEQMTAFTSFKLEFYQEVCKRNGVRLLKMGDIPEGPNDYPAMNISKDGKKVTALRVEKEG